MARLQTWHIDWLILTPFFLVLTSTRLSPQCLPLHDSMQVFQAFHFIYSGWLFEGEIAQWAPYGSYGYPFDVWASFCLTPASYVAAAIGKLLNVTDALLLFKFAMALEELMFLIGLYALCRLSLQRRSAVLFVCLGALLGLNWLFQLWWNFRLFYMVPAGLAFLVLFFERQQPRYLWLAGVVFVTSLIGNLPYYAPVYLFISLVFGGCLQLLKPVPRHALLSRSWRDVGPLLLLLALAGYYLHGVRDYMSVMVSATGRDQSGGTTLGNFLLHGANPDVLELFRSAILGWPIVGKWKEYFDLPVYSPDQIFYIGLLPWFFLVWAAVRVRHPLFLALAGTTLALFWFACGGLMAAVIFHLPSMAWFRHVGLLYNLCKLLILICAGFGFQDFLDNARPIHLYVLAGVALLTADAFMHFRFLMAIKNLLHDTAVVEDWKAMGDPLLDVHTVFVTRILLYVVAALATLGAATRVSTPAGATIRSPLLAGALLLVYIFDMGSFLWVSQFIVNPLPDSLTATLDSTRAEPLEFADIRSSEPRSERGQSAARLMEFVRFEALPEYVSGLNHVTYLFLRQDPCSIELEPGRRVLFSPFRLKTVDRLLKAPVDEWNAHALRGCHLPRLRLFADSGKRVTPDEFCAIVNDEPEAAITLIESQGSDTGSLAQELQEASIRVVHFSANRLTIEVDRPEDARAAWLYYADGYHADWQARVNGVETPIARASLAFKAVAVPPGHSVVELVFRPGWRLGHVYVIGLLGIPFWLALYSILLMNLARDEET